MSGGAVGAIVLPPIAGAWIQEFGWRTTSMMLGAMVLAIGVPAAALFVRERPANRAEDILAPTATAGATCSTGSSHRGCQSYCCRAQPSVRSCSRRRTRSPRGRCRPH
jgi:hypothetical protein